jgi:hypothetical protein
MSQKSITDLNINSITLSNSNYAGLTGFTAQSSTLYTSNSGVLLVNGVPISSGGGGAVDALEEGDGITVVESPTGTFTIDNDGVLELTAGTNITISGSKTNYTINSTGGGGGAVSSIIAGTGITIDPVSGVGDVTINSDVNPADYYTASQADGLFQTLTDMANYSTTAQADGLYQSQASMANYSTTAQADGLYAPINSGVLSLAAGDGISISDTTGDITVGNTGVVALTAGAGISITGGNDNKTITNISSAPIITTYNLPDQLALTPVGDALELMNATTNFVPIAGTYIINIFLLMQSYNASGTPGPYIGSGTIYLIFNNIEYINQPFTITTNSEPAFFQASTILQCNGTDFIQLALLVNALASGGTQYNTGTNPGNYAPLITLTQIG